MKSPKRWLIDVDQATAVLVFSIRHAVEYSGRGGILLAQLGRIGSVDAAVLLFGGDGQGEHLLLR